MSLYFSEKNEGPERENCHCLRDSGLANLSGDRGCVSVDHQRIPAQIGENCEICWPVYASALFESIDADGPKKFLNDPVFVNGVLLAETRNEVFKILGKFEDDLDLSEVLRLKEFFMRGINSNDYTILEDFDLKGLTLSEALGCLADYVRTSRFLKGLFLHIEDLENDNENIEVVDAGCGPLPFFGLMAALKSEKASVTCLEINEASAEMARKIIANAGLSDRVKVIWTDATKYSHDKEIDLLFTETMYAGLTNKEPIIQILMNLCEQLSEKSRVVPEWVTVDAGLIRDRDRGEIFGNHSHIDLQKSGFAELTELIRFTKDNLSDVIELEFDVADLPEGLYRLVINSRVGLHDSLTLDNGESCITSPLELAYPVSIDAFSERLIATYKAGSDAINLELR